MHKNIVALMALIVLLPTAASAHQVTTFKIGNWHYQFVVGSLGEPVVVDDKTGLDLSVYRCKTGTCMPHMSDDGDMDGPAGTPVAGLDQTLKLEIRAGSATREMPIKQMWGKEGSYTAAFYPTVATTYTYRLYGTIDNVPVNLSFACTPEGSKPADDMNELALSNVVTRTKQTGAFGCPLEKEKLSFP